MVSPLAVLQPVAASRCAGLDARFGVGSAVWFVADSAHGGLLAGVSVGGVAAATPVSALGDGVGRVVRSALAVDVPH